MSINEKKQALSQGSAGPGKFPPPTSPTPGQFSPSLPSKPVKPDASIFGGKQYISKRDFQRSIRKASGAIPGTGGARYTKRELAALAKEMGSGFGDFLQKGKFEDARMFKQLRGQRYAAKTGAAKLAIDRKIRFLERELKGKGKTR